MSINLDVEFCLHLLRLLAEYSALYVGARLVLFINNSRCGGERFWCGRDSCRQERSTPSRQKE